MRLQDVEDSCVVWLWHGLARISEKHAATPLRNGVDGRAVSSSETSVTTTLLGVTSLKTTIRIHIDFAVLRSRCVWDDPSYKRDALSMLPTCLAAFTFSPVSFVGPLWDAGESGFNEVLRKGRRRGVNIYPP